MVTLQYSQIQEHLWLEQREDPLFLGSQQQLYCVWHTLRVKIVGSVLCPVDFPPVSSILAGAVGR